MTFPLKAVQLGYSFSFGTPPLLRDLNFEVRPGEVLAIVGPSGSGKTTLCHCMSGIIPLILGGTMTGDVQLHGVSTRKLTPARIAQCLGIVFQNPETQLFFSEVADEIAFGPENLCVPPFIIEKRIDEALEKVGLPGFRGRNPHELSGGEKQRLALAAVLSLDPSILIFDEVTAHLDQDGTHRIRAIIKSLKQEGRTIVMVDHDPHQLEVADRILLLKDGTLRNVLDHDELVAIL